MKLLKNLLKPKFLIVLLLLLSFLLHFWRIGQIKELVFDEVYFAKFAQDYLTFKECPQYLKDKYPEDKGCYDVHPPLGKLLIAVGQYYLGTAPFLDYEKKKEEYEQTKARNDKILDFRYDFSLQSVLAFRVIPAFFGVLLILLIYLVAFFLFNNSYYALLAAFLAFLDNYFLTQSRLALMDIFLIDFQLLAIIFLLWARKNVGIIYYLLFILSAFFTGCALGVKFNGLSIILVIFTVFFVDLIKSFQQKNVTLKIVVFNLFKTVFSSIGILALISLYFYFEYPPTSLVTTYDKLKYILTGGFFEEDLVKNFVRYFYPLKRFFVEDLKFIFGDLMRIPFDSSTYLFVYLSALAAFTSLFFLESIKHRILGFFSLFLKYFSYLLGYLGIAFLTFLFILKLPSLLFGHPFPWEDQIQDKLNYHQNLTATHPYSSTWQTWPLSIKPVFYYYRTFSPEELGPILDGSSHYVSAINAHGNPLIWILGGFSFLVMFIYVVLNAKSNFDDRLLFLIICAGFLGNWLPWSFISRVSFLYHFLPAIPFLILSLTWLFKFLFSFKRNPFIKGIAWILLILIVGVFYYFLPLSLGTPITNKEYEARNYPYFLYR